MDLLAGVPADFGTLALGLVLAGVVGGLIAGMLGVGGGIVVVPVLYHVLAGLGVPESMRMHVAVGTSLATIIPTSISSLRAHAAKGAVDWGLLRRWIGPMLLGVIAGSLIAGSVRGETLSLIFAIVAIPVAIHMAFDGAGRTIANQPPGGVTGVALPFGIGGISTMMGIGGGTVGVPLMTLFGMPIHSAVATASAFGAIISIPGTIGAVLSGWHLPGLPPYSFGYVNALGFVLIAPVSFFLAPVGAWLAHSVDRTRLRRMFALFIAVTAARMLWDVLF
jgi:uncharacterized membrane protein YfcA